MAAPFVVTGIETLRDPGRRAERIAPVIKPLADRCPGSPARTPRRSSGCRERSAWARARSWPWAGSSGCRPSCSPVSWSRACWPSTGSGPRTTRSGVPRALPVLQERPGCSGRCCRRDRPEPAPTGQGGPHQRPRGAAPGGARPGGGRPQGRARAAQGRQARRGSPPEGRQDRPLTPARCLPGVSPPNVANVAYVAYGPAPIRLRSPVVRSRARLRGVRSRRRRGMCGVRRSDLQDLVDVTKDRAAPERPSDA